MPGINMWAVFRAQLHASIYWYKNNKWLAVTMFFWPYLMILVLVGLGSIMGSFELYTERMNLSSPGFYLISASAIAMTSVGIIDGVAGFALYNRWLGTLNYIILSPIRESKLFIAAGLPDSLLSALVTIVAVMPAAIYVEGLLGSLKLLIILAFMLAGMIPLIGLSVLAASALLVVKEESNIINSIVPFILLVSGVFYPITVLPRILQAVSLAVPTRYVVDAAKMVSTFGTPSGAALMLLLGMLALLGIIYNTIAGVAIMRAEKAVKMRGVD